MTRRKRRRMVMLAAGMAGLAGAALLMGFAFRDNIVFFYSPSELAQRPVEPGQRIRLGGLVETGSLSRQPGDDLAITFRIADLADAVPVVYRGILPDLFREGQGVVTEGSFDGGGRFVADQVLAKHDETYMPREVADALKKSGEWRGGDAATY